jgi:hypothetical protein
MKTWRIMLVVLATLALAGIAYAGSISPSALKPVTGVNKVIDDPTVPVKVSSVTYPKQPIHITSDSPGDSLDFTWYDFQANGSMSRQIVLDHVGLHGIHVVYMKAPNNTLTPRNIGYQFNDRTGTGWNGEVDANSQRAGYGTVATMADGRAAVSFHQAGGSGNRSVVALDATRGAGAFTVTSVDTVTFPPGAGAGPVWPHVGVSSGGNIVVAAHQNTISLNMWSTSDNGGTSYSHWAFVEPSNTDTSVENCIAHDVIPGPSGKVAIAFVKWTGHGRGQIGMGDLQRNMDVWFIESTDNGMTWGAPVNVTSYQAADTVRAYNDVSGVFDASGNLHLVWTGARVINDSLYTQAAAIWHWNQGGGGITRVSGAGNVTGTYWWSYDALSPDVWSQTVTRPSLSMDSTGNLYCVWVGQFEQPADTSSEGFENCDLYGSGSINNGITWTTPFNITNSHTPGALPGACADDEWPSIAAFSPDSVRIFWEVDRDAGSFITNPSQGQQTSNPFHYLGVAKSSFVGVEQGPKPVVQMPGQYELGMARPNPVGQMTEIAYALPVARNVTLSVYNTAGQLVKVLESGSKAPGFYTARWNAGSVPAGVYFYRLTAGEFRQTRSMVVVR